MGEHHLYNIPPGADFLKCLAHGAKLQFGDALSKALLLLPTRRACQHLRDAFLAEQGGGEIALLLPDIRPLGEVEEEELMLSADAEFLKQVTDIPPAMEEHERRVLLTHLVEGMKVPGVSKAQAYFLAGDLGQLIDDSLIEDCDLKDLAGLVPERYAAHWQQIIKFLHIVTDNWPKILQIEGKIDAVDYRQRLTRLLIAHWQKNPPNYPVIAAGSTGSQPVTRDLLACIAGLPNGVVVLPGLDTHLEEEAWAELPPTHPQYYLARFLKKLEAGRDEVKEWPGATDGARAVLLSETMRPSEAADRWRHLKPGEIDAVAWHGLEVIEAAQEHEEALAAALMLRKAAEEKDKTAALVTPDRALAKRVAALMRRWDIELDDSAGTPLSEKPVGSYLSLLLDLPTSTLRPSQLMAFLKHPFTGVGQERTTLLGPARELETTFFRKMPRGRGLKNWAAQLKSHKLTPTQDAIEAAASKETNEILEKLCGYLKPFFSDAARPLHEWTADLETVAENLLASDAAMAREAEGEALARLFDANAESDLVCGFDDFAEIFRVRLQQAVVRRPWGQHPRLAILGLLEARLLRFDHVILGGLNEGTWPQEIKPDPWMSFGMRVDLGCADPEARIGQMAHDFLQAASGPHVSILRTKRSGETPTIPSRWLARLDTVRKLVGAEFPETPWLAYARAIDFSKELEPCDPPAVSVATKALPSRLTASAIEMWVQDPYAFYARYVLGLRALDGLDNEFGARERGQLIHKALEYLAHKYPKHWPPEAEQEFVQRIRDGFVAYGCAPGEVELLSARLADMAHEYWVFEQDRRAQTTLSKSECQGSLPMQVNDYAFKLEARADRVDVLKTGGASILDYKTTTLPPKKDIKAGLRPQLYVEAIMGEDSGFKDVPPPISEIAYVVFDQNKSKVSLQAVDLPLNAANDIHRPGFENFIRAYLAKNARYLSAPRPQLVDPAPDYARLARVAEWSKGAVEQEEGDA